MGIGKRRKYSVSFKNPRKPRKSEKQIRKFLFNKADAIRLTEYTWTEFSLWQKDHFVKVIKHGGGKDRRSISVIDALNPFLIRRFSDHTRYDNVRHPFISAHYLYKNVRGLRALLNKETLIWRSEISKRFYGLEDPTFYKGKAMLGSVITHESMIILYLTNSEKKMLEKEGVIFD